MSATIESKAHMAAQPVGTVISHVDPFNGHEVAVRTPDGWDVSGQRWATEAAGNWIGADIMTRKADLLRLAERLDALAGLSSSRTVDLDTPGQVSA